MNTSSSAVTSNNTNNNGAISTPSGGGSGGGGGSNGTKGNGTSIVCSSTGGGTTAGSNVQNTSRLPSVGAETEDLIHLPGPLTEDAVIKCLHARFSAKQYYVSIELIIANFNKKV